LYINFKRIDHIQICIPKGKENDARKFYTSILGLKEVEKPVSLKPNGGIWYEIADIQIHIGVEDGENYSKRHPAFEVEDLETVKNYLKGNNILINEEIHILGIKRFSFKDPFGNRMELLEKIK